MLYWVDKFRELSDSKLTDVQIIRKFEAFCYEEERKLKERLEVKQ